MQRAADRRCAATLATAVPARQCAGATADASALAAALTTAALAAAPTPTLATTITTTAFPATSTLAKKASRTERTRER